MSVSKGGKLISTVPTTPRPPAPKSQAAPK